MASSSAGTSYQRTGSSAQYMYMSNPSTYEVHTRLPATTMFVIIISSTLSQMSMDGKIFKVDVKELHNIVLTLVFSFVVVVLCSATSGPVEHHLHTIQSGATTQTGWEILPNPATYWYNRNESVTARYDGSAVNVPLKMRFKRKIGLCDSRKADVWRAAAVELAGTAGLTFLSITASQQGSSIPTLAVLQSLIYSLAILAATPVSGGHLNPAVTFTTFLAGPASLTRSLLYIVAQFGGGILGAAAVACLTSPEILSKYYLGGCLLHQAPPATPVAGAAVIYLDHKQGLLAEALFTCIMLFVAYGVGFDARSVAATFPVASPFLIGGVVGLLGFISRAVGYSAAMNPARCLGPAVMHRDAALWDPLSVFICAPFAAAVVVGIFQLMLRQAEIGSDLDPILPLNFFQVVTPDHRRPGFGARGTPQVFPLVVDDDGARADETTTSMAVLQLPPIGTSPPPAGSGDKMKLVLQIKALMQPIGWESGRPSAATMMDVAHRSCDGNLILQHSAGDLSDAAAVPASDPEKLTS